MGLPEGVWDADRLAVGEAERVVEYGRVAERLALGDRVRLRVRVWNWLQVELRVPLRAAVAVKVGDPVGVADPDIVVVVLG